MSRKERARILEFNHCDRLTDGLRQLVLACEVNQELYKKAYSSVEVTGKLEEIRQYIKDLLTSVENRKEQMVRELSATNPT